MPFHFHTFLPMIREIGDAQPDFFISKTKRSTFNDPEIVFVTKTLLPKEWNARLEQENFAVLLFSAANLMAFWTFFRCTDLNCHFCKRKYYNTFFFSALPSFLGSLNSRVALAFSLSVYVCIGYRYNILVTFTVCILHYIRNNTLYFSHLKWHQQVEWRW